MTEWKQELLDLLDESKQQDVSEASFGSAEEEEEDRNRNNNPDNMANYVFRKQDLPRLNLDVDDISTFETWEDSWQSYYRLSKLATQDAETQRDVLNMAFDGQTIKTVKNLGIRAADKNNVEVIIKAMKTYVTGRRNKRTERYNYHKRNMHPNETVREYIVALRNLASTCQYEDMTAEEIVEDTMVDRFISGCCREDIVQRLLQEKDLDLENLISIAESVENSKKDTKHIQGDNKDVNAARFNGKNKKPFKEKNQNKPQSQRPSNNTCGRCGNNHEKDKCPAKDQVCSKCNKKGHYQKMCRTGDKKSDKKTGNVTKRVGGAHKTINEPSNEHHPVKCTAHTTGMSATIHMLPDTGAEMTLAGPKFAKKLGIKLNQLKPSQINPIVANNTSAKVLGMTEVTFEVNGVKSEEEVYIFADCSGPLISQLACKRLGFIHQDFPKPLALSKYVKEIRHMEKSNDRIEPASRTDRDGPLTKEGLIAEFPRVFDGVIRTMPGEKYKIELEEEARPFCVRTPRTVPLPLTEKLKDELDLLEQQGIIAKQTKATDWCAPIVVAPKKNSDKIRLCVDFTKLNKFVKRERYMSNTPAEAVLNIKGAQFFSVFDAVKGYHQCELDEESQDLTTFITPHGTYKYLRAPYGIKSISEHYNRRMDEYLNGVPNLAKIVDDCALYAASEKEHEQQVRQFLQRCEEKQISLNSEKMQVCKKSVKFGGFDLRPDGYSMSEDITRSIVNFPTPDSRKTLRGYFGLANQLASSNGDVAKLLEPMRGLLKTSNDFIWTPAHEEAFKESREALSKTIRLRFYDVDKETRLCTDASRTGLGFVLQQTHKETWKTVQTGSRFLTDAESRYAVIELEMLGVAWAIQKCKYFLSGLRHFEIVTDHNPLVPILNSHRLDEIENPRLQRLRTRIMGYNFTARHIKGKDNDAPDALSRYPTDKPNRDEELAEMEPTDNSVALTFKEIRASAKSPIYPSSGASASTNPSHYPSAGASASNNPSHYPSHSQEEDYQREHLHVTELREHADKDDEYNHLKQVVMEGFPDDRNKLPDDLKKYWRIKENLTVDDDLLLYGVRLYVPKSLRPALLVRMHEAHQGISRMQARARLALYWPGIDEDVENFVRACRHCIERQAKPPKEPLIQKPRPERPFQEVAVDYAEKNGHKFIIIVDCKTDWPDIIRCKNGNTSAKALIKDLRATFCRTAVPNILWSDQGPQFTSAELKQFLAEWGVRHMMSSPRNPQSNGKAESAVKSMKNLITSSFKGGNADLEEDKLARALLQYRNTPNKRDGLSPAQKLFGRSVQDSLPVHRKAMAKKTQEEFKIAEEKAEINDKKAADHYNQHTKMLPDFKIGQHVVIYNEKVAAWNIYGSVVEKITSRRYVVKTKSGVALTRNKKFIRAHLHHVLKPTQNNGPAQAAGPGAATPLAAPPAHQAAAAPPTTNEMRRKSTRPKKKPSRLVEDPSWH